ncbi:MAG: DUF937 domain-containing protein [Planctomycetota bacterium]
MPTLGDLLQKTLDREAIERMGQRVEADERATRRGVVASAAVLAEAMKNNARRRGGDRALYEAIERDHDGSVLERRDEVFAGQRDDDGMGILRHVLGENQDAAAGAVGQFAGLDKGKALQLLIMLAPLIMGVLGKMKKEGGIEQPKRLPDVFGRGPVLPPPREPDGTPGSTPDLGGILEQILKGRGTGQSPSGGAGGPGCMSLLGPLLGGGGR